MLLTHSLMIFVSNTVRNIHVWVDVQSILTGSRLGENIMEQFVIWFLFGKKMHPLVGSEVCGSMRQGWRDPPAVTSKNWPPVFSLHLKINRKPVVKIIYNKIICFLIIYFLFLSPCSFNMAIRVVKWLISIVFIIYAPSQMSPFMHKNYSCKKKKKKTHTSKLIIKQIY